MVSNYETPWKAYRIGGVHGFFVCGLMIEKHLFIIM